MAAVARKSGPMLPVATPELPAARHLELLPEDKASDNDNYRSLSEAAAGGTVYGEANCRRFVGSFAGGNVPAGGIASASKAYETNWRTLRLSNWFAQGL